MRDEPKLKKEAEQNYCSETPRPMSLGECAKPAQPHPCEILLRQLNDQEQVLLDKVMALRQIREEVRFIDPEECERLLKISRLTKWKVIAEGALLAQNDALTGRLLDEREKFVAGTFIRQRRECEKCGKIQLRRATDT